MDWQKVENNDPTVGDYIHHLSQYPSDTPFLFRDSNPDVCIWFRYKNGEMLVKTDDM